MKLTRTLLVLALCMFSALLGAVVSQTLPVAKAQTTSPAAVATMSSSVQAQGSYGSGGAYTVVPVMDSGAGYSWMAYAVAFAPDGKVTIISTHPKKTDELGSIVKQFNIK